MALVETLATTLASSVAKWVCGLWLGEGLGKELSGGIIDILAHRVPNFLQRNQIQRQFSEIAESAAVKLDALISAEFSTVASNERDAAIFVASAAMQRVDIELYFEVDADPIRLKQEILRKNRTAVDKEYLSQSAVGLYEILVQECCYYISEITSTLPRFVALAAVEGLRRDTEIIDIAQKVLARLPDPLQVARNESDRKDLYEGDYRRFVAQKFDRLELFGLTFREISARYALTVAYITLTVRKSLAVSISDTGHFVESATKAPAGGLRSDEDNIRADVALADCGRSFIRGAAGSGKTTLLHWIAVRCARREFESPLDRWNDRIPIMLQLRRFTSRELPEPGEFLRFTSSGISQSAPDDWVHEQMSCGRALLLIDGVDEMPEVKRADVRNWIGDLLRSYPECDYVVTSRPAAVPENWLSGERFVAMELQPMTMSAIRSFVDHWHEAAARDLKTPDGLSELKRYKVSLIDSIAESPALRNLATTPLLCAMLCALNQDRRTQIPGNRVELYQVALEMLLDRRDVERGFADADKIVLNLTQKTRLLRDFAYWLAVNYLTDAPIEKLSERLASKLGNMRVGNVAAVDVAKYLLVRSGLLRETVPGRVDFIHRTFQEYLTAEEIVAEDNVGLLVRHATEDEWREVVILTAGIVESRTRASALLNSLLDRGEREPKHKHRLHLLAVACLETAEEVDANVRKRVEKALEHLLPPSSMTEARAVSSAGALALPRLASFNDRVVAQAAPCVRTASLVGGDEALPVLAAFGADHRITVQKELIRAWSAWPDPVEFAEVVLANSPLKTGFLELSDTALIPAVHKLLNLRRLRIWADSDIDALDVLETVPQFREFAAGHNRHLDNLDFLRGCHDIDHVDVEYCSRLTSIAALRGKRFLTLVDISSTEVDDISPLEESPELGWFAARKCSKIEDWSALRGLPKLRHVSLAGNDSVRDLDMLQSSNELQTVNVASCSNLTNVDALGRQSKLTSIVMDECAKVADFTPLRMCKRLHMVSVSNNAFVTDLSWADNASNLRVVCITSCPNLRNVLGLVSEKLVTAIFDRCSNLSDISPLGLCLGDLNFLSLSGTGVADLSSIEGGLNLTNLDVSNCLNLEDLSVLESLPNLRALRVGGLSVKAVDSIRLNRKASPVYIYGYRSQNEQLDSLRERYSGKVHAFKLPDPSSRSSR